MSDIVFRSYDLRQGIITVAGPVVNPYAFRDRAGFLCRANPGDYLIDAFDDVYVLPAAVFRLVAGGEPRQEEPYGGGPVDGSGLPDLEP